MSIPAHISHITLGVAVVARSTAFYRSLGWEQAGGSEDAITFLRLDNVVVALYGGVDLAADALQPPSAANGIGFRGVTLAINVLTPAAVDRMYREFVAAGAVGVKPPEPTEWGGYSGYVADPDGHLWELAHNPFSPEWAAPVTE